MMAFAPDEQLNNEFIPDDGFIPDPEPAQPKKLFGGVRGDIESRAFNLAQGIESGQTLPETVLQTAGQATGLGFDILGRGLSSITPEFIKKPIRAGIQRIFQTEPVQKITGKVQEVAEKHPRLFRNVEAGVNIAGFVPAISGLSRLGQSGFQAGKLGISTIRGQLAERAEQKLLQEALKLTQPVLGKRETIQVFEKAGKPGGIDQKSKFGKITKQPTLEEVEIAQTAQPFIGGSKGVSRNLYNLNQEIGRFSSSEVRPFLHQNPRIFNLNQFESRLKKIEPPDWIKADVTAEKTYNLVRQRMVDAAKQNPKNMEGLWDSRIDFDNIVERQFGGAVFDPNKRGFVNQAVRDMRKATNEFIGESIGDRRFAEAMKRLTRLYEARGNIAEQKYKLLDKNFLQRYYTEHPGTAKFITRVGLGTGGLYGYFQLRDFLGD